MRGGFESRARRDGIVLHSGFGPRGVSFRRSSLSPTLRRRARARAREGARGVARARAAPRGGPECDTRGGRGRAHLADVAHGLRHGRLERDALVFGDDRVGGVECCVRTDKRVRRGRGGGRGSATERRTSRGRRPDARRARRGHPGPGRASTRAPPRLSGRAAEISPGPSIFFFFSRERTPPSDAPLVAGRAHQRVVRAAHQRGGHGRAHFAERLHRGRRRGRAGDASTRVGAGARVRAPLFSELALKHRRTTADESASVSSIIEEINRRRRG